MAITTHPQPGPRHRVLVVDDEPDIVYLVKHLLEGAGFDVHETTTGRDAIEDGPRDIQTQQQQRQLGHAGVRGRFTERAQIVNIANAPPKVSITPSIAKTT